MILPIKGKEPRIAATAYVAPNASVIGDVEMGPDSSVWFGAIIRGDSNSIRVGSRTNVQDLCVLHVDSRHALRVGDDVTIGHRATLHGCTIADRVLVGMGATVMNGAEIGPDCIVGAASLVTEDTKVPPRSLILGVPAKIMRELTDDEIASIRTAAAHYSQTAVDVYRDHR